MNPIKIKYEYSGKVFYLSPYNTSQEKSILLMDSLGSKSLDNALEICEVDNEIIKSLSDEEKIAMLYKLRSISVGEEISIKYNCVHCKTTNDAHVNIEDNIKSSNITNDLIIDKFKKITEDNKQEFLKIPIDEIYLDEYDKIMYDLYTSITKFTFKKEIKCLKCRNNNIVDISKMVIEQMSEDSISSIYQIYSDLNYFGNYTKQDIDSMLPFERTILLGLLNKTREEVNLAIGRK